MSKANSIKVKVVNNKIYKASDYATLAIPIQQVNDIKTAFDIFDSDASGIVDPLQIKKAFQQLGFSGENKFVYQILAQLDDDQSGGIDFAQFLRLATAKLNNKDSRADIQKIFQTFDSSHIGKISTRQLKKVIQDVGQKYNEEQILHIFNKADLDDDGFVTGQDFYNILTNKIYWDI